MSRHRRRGPRRVSVAAGVVAAVVALGACGDGAGSRGSTTALDDSSITVASFNFPESALLAEIYGQALEARGYRVERRLEIGAREFVEPALARGLVEFIPEYGGTALQFLSLGASPPSTYPLTTHEALVRVLSDESIVALDAAPAQNVNGIVVTHNTALRYGLRRISDLRPVAGELTFGGPPECPARPFCLEGLEQLYGLEFSEFVPLDAGGPLTVQALLAGEVDVALLFTTDSAISDGRLALLTDDLGLQPAENVTPLVRREVVERWGEPFVEAIDEVSARLTTGGLRLLNAETGAGDDIEDVAAKWLSEQRLDG
ncbi:ABC transporter substrate-binding protein [soil metagenome]